MQGGGVTSVQLCLVAATAPSMEPLARTASPQSQGQPHGAS